LPFNTIDGSALLGEIDVAFLAVYSVGMFFAGHLGDRMDLRIFLTIGMFGTAVFTALFGAGYWLNIHNFYYFLVIQMIAGLFQAIGWPSVVAIVGNWFGKSKRGLIMGIWNAHTSVGNISGSLLAAFLLKFGWGWSFAIPSLIMVAVGLLVFVFLPVSPEVMEIDIDDGEISSVKDTTKEPLLEPGQEVKHNAVGFLEAWKIPGVAPFALCLFFSKLVAYTFLYWLPFYISHTRKRSFSNFLQLVCKTVFSVLF
jgi:OPA family glycerol-3-phosphate transporter-like MFS transporter 1/2